MEPHRLFRALADPTRLRILNRLLYEPACVWDLAGTLGLPQSLVSWHLACLRSADLVRDRRSGTRANYSVVLEVEKGQALGDFLRHMLQRAEPFEADIRDCQHQTAAASSP